ncbi:ribonuclease H-like domain-containing protein [Tanacetum coccineum]
MFTCTLAQYVAHKTNVAQQFTPQKHYRLPHPGQGILSPAPAIYASQPTTLPSAFSIMPSQDPTWHMDTGASSHLNFNASNLSTIFDKRLFPSVHVGDGKSIPVTNTDHNIIPSHHRPLHLHNVLDYLTRHILLRCDSSGDLYPVIQPFNSSYCFSLDKCFHVASTPRTSDQWPIHQLDVKNAFLNGDLSETVYMHQPHGFIDARFPNHGSQVAYLLIYVDDIILTASSPTLLQQIIDSLHNKKYALHLLERAHMVHCNPSRTPVDTKYKLGLEGVPVQDPILYRSLAEGLQYLTFTRLDLSYAVHQVYLYMHDLREPHFSTLKRILRYVRGTVDFGLQLYAFATTSLVGYTDADWAGFPSTRRSTLGYCIFLGDSLLSWSAKRHHTISRSSVEAE